MKLVIIPVDGAVYVEGVSFSGLDLSFCPQNIHALQWKDTHGWIEFVDNFDGTKPQNQVITELPIWVTEAITKWEAAKIEEEARIAAEIAAKEDIKIPVTVTDGGTTDESTTN